MFALNSTCRFTTGLIISGAILLLTACGSGSDSSQQPSAVKEQVVANEPVSAHPNNYEAVSETGEAWVASGSSTHSSSSSVSTPSSDNAGVVKGWTNASQSSSARNLQQAKSSAPAVNAPSSLAATASSLTSRSSSSKGSVSSAAPSNKIGVLEWEHPTERANGEYLELEEIAGYELRYSRDDEHYESVVIQGSRTTFYKIPSILNNIAGLKVQIAVFDTDGLYSEFVDISPSIN